MSSPHLPPASEVTHGYFQITAILRQHCKNVFETERAPYRWRGRAGLPRRCHPGELDRLGRQQRRQLRDRRQSGSGLRHPARRAYRLAEQSLPGLSHHVPRCYWSRRQHLWHGLEGERPEQLGVHNRERPPEGRRPGSDLHPAKLFSGRRRDRFPVRRRQAVHVRQLVEALEQRQCSYRLRVQPERSGGESRESWVLATSKAKGRRFPRLIRH